MIDEWEDDLVIWRLIVSLDKGVDDWDGLHIINVVNFTCALIM